MRCEKCGAEIDNESRFCWKCGASVIAMVQRPKGQNICPSCGKELPADSKFCIYCGNVVAEGNFDDNQTTQGSSRSNYDYQQTSQGSGRSNYDYQQTSQGNSQSNYAYQQTAGEKSETEYQYKQLNPGKDETEYSYKNMDEERGKSDYNPQPKKGKLSPVQIIIVAVGIIVLALLAVFLIIKQKDSDNGKDKGGNVSSSSTEGSSKSGTDGEVTLNESDFESKKDIAYKTDCFSFSLPEYWPNLTEKDQDETTISFYQKKSVDEGYDGLLFTVAQVDEDEVDTIDDYDLIDTDGDMCYVLIYPTEDTYNTKDKYTELEYKRLMKDTSYISTGFKVTETKVEPTVTSTPANGDYVIPDSDSRYLTRDDLTSLSAQQLRWARNEIYARKGRRFKDDSLQAYFDSKSWYNGTIDPDDFTDSMLTDVEKKNAEFIRAYENEIGVNQ